MDPLIFCAFRDSQYLFYLSALSEDSSSPFCDFLDVNVYCPSMKKASYNNCVFVLPRNCVCSLVTEFGFLFVLFFFCSNHFYGVCFHPLCKLLFPGFVSLLVFFPVCDRNARRCDPPPPRRCALVRRDQVEVIWSFPSLSSLPLSTRSGESPSFPPVLFFLSHGDPRVGFSVGKSIPIIESVSVSQADGVPPPPDPPADPFFFFSPSSFLPARRVPLPLGAGRDDKYLSQNLFFYLGGTKISSVHFFSLTRSYRLLPRLLARSPFFSTSLLVL